MNTFLNTFVALGLIIQIFVIRKREKVEEPQYTRLTLLYDWIGIIIWTPLILDRLYAVLITREPFTIFSIILIVFMSTLIYYFFIKELVKLHRR